MISSLKSSSSKIKNSVASSAKSKIINVELLYKNKKIEKDFENIQGSTWKDLIASVSPYLTTDIISDSVKERKKLNIDNDAYLNYELSYKGKYINLDSEVKSKSMLVYDSYLSYESFLDRVNPSKDKSSELEKLLFNKNENFFDYFKEKQENVSSQRLNMAITNKSYDADVISKRLNKFSSFQSNSGLSGLSTILSFLISNGFKIKYGNSYESKNSDKIMPHIEWTQDFSNYNRRYIFGHVEEFNIDTNQESKEKIYSQIEKIVLKKILNTDDLRYINIDNNKKITDISITNSFLLEMIKEISNENGKINDKKGFANEMVTIKKDILDIQDEIYSSFIISNKYLQIRADQFEDKVIKSIISSKLYLLEVEYSFRLIKNIIENNNTSKFHIYYKPIVQKKVFDLFHILRKFSQRKEERSKRHQFGIYYINGFASICIWSRPFDLEVETSFSHAVTSKIFNLNCDLNGNFENEKDLSEFVKLINLYSYSYSEEVEALKDIWDRRSLGI